MALNYITAQEAAALVKNDDNVGFGGFTHAGCPKVVPVEIAKRAEEEHAKVTLLKSGFYRCFYGDSIDGALAVPAIRISCSLSVQQRYAKSNQ